MRPRSRPRADAGGFATSCRSALRLMSGRLAVSLPSRLEEVEDIVDQANPALAVARGLGLRKAGQWLRPYTAIRVFCIPASRVAPTMAAAWPDRYLRDIVNLVSRQRRKDWHSVRKGACVWILRRRDGAARQTLSPGDRADPGLASVRGLDWPGPNRRREGCIHVHQT